VGSNEQGGRQVSEPGKKQILEYVRTPMPLLMLRDLCDKQKWLLSMIMNCKTGFNFKNEILADIFDVSQQRISELLTDLEEKGYIKIEARQSRWRIIYFQENTKVSKDLLSSFDGFTFEKSGKYKAGTFAKTREYFQKKTKPYNRSNKEINRKEEIKNNKTACARDFSFSHSDSEKKKQGIVIEV
jgi:DNA-binding transcriptional ArsR family regulator